MAVHPMFNTGFLMRAAALAACLLPLASHALSEEPLDMAYEAPKAATSRDGLTAPAARAVAGTCALQVVQLEDSRFSKATLGGNAFMGMAADSTPIIMQAVRSGDGRPWLRSAVLSLASEGFSVTEGGTTPAPTMPRVAMDVRLRMAQAWPVGMNLASNVAVEARYRTSAGDITRMYVGQGMKANWAGGNGEYMDVLNAAMADAVAILAQEAGALCAGRTLAASQP